MSDASEQSVACQLRPNAISFGEGPPQAVVYVEHLREALTCVRENKIVSIEVSTHGPKQPAPLIDFSFLDELPDLLGLECRMNISKKSDLGPVHRLKKLRQLAWPARTTPVIDFSCFPQLEYLSFKHLPDTTGWDTLSRLRVLRLAFSGDTDLGFLQPLKSLERLEVADSPIESMAGVEHLDRLEKLQIFISPKLTNVSTVAKCKSLKHLYVDKTKVLSDYSALGESKSIETLQLLTPIDSVAFVSRMSALTWFFCHEVRSNDLSPLLQAKSLKYLDIYPDKRTYAPRLTDVKLALGI